MVAWFPGRRLNVRTRQPDPACGRDGSQRGKCGSGCARPYRQLLFRRLRRRDDPQNVRRCAGRIRLLKTMVTYYVALPFVRLENGGLAPGQAVECPHSSAAIRCAGALSHSEINAGAVAFSRSGSAELGEFDDAVVLKT